MAQNHTRIGKGTVFKGTIHTEKLTVEGTVQGEVTASADVLLTKDAVVKGLIETPKILLEEGARHQGKLQLWQNETADDSVTDSSVSSAVEQDDSGPGKSEELKKQEPETTAGNTQKDQRLW